MTFVEWLFDTTKNVRNDGTAGLKESLYQLYLGVWRRLGRIYNYGTPIYERDWNVLIVLDACRYDLMAEVTSEYDFVSTETTSSVASTSAEWLEKNFKSTEHRTDVRGTAYITGNPFTDEVFFRQECPECGATRKRTPGKDCKACGTSQEPTRVPDHEFQILDEVWQYGWDEELGTIPPTSITNRAIATWRNESVNQMVVHYMQPHHPFIDSDIQTSLSPKGFGEMGRESVWDLLRAGKVDRDRVWEDYRTNLEYALNDVSRLLENIDADQVVITADHGNSVGEWGLYGHYRNVPLPEMKRVPWCVTRAENIHNDEIKEPVQPEDNCHVEKRLEDLGYL